MLASVYYAAMSQIDFSEAFKGTERRIMLSVELKDLFAPVAEHKSRVNIQTYHTGLCAGCPRLCHVRRQLHDYVL